MKKKSNIPVTCVMLDFVKILELKSHIATNHQGKSSYKCNNCLAKDEKEHLEEHFATVHEGNLP